MKQKNKIDAAEQNDDIFHTIISDIEKDVKAAHQESVHRLDKDESMTDNDYEDLFDAIDPDETKSNDNDYDYVDYDIID